jgi:acyl-CoA thioesterase-1
MSRRLLLLCAATAAVCGFAALSRAAAADCSVPAELTEVSAKLPHLAARLHARRPVTIVAIGGASTRGAAAGGAEFAYPHRLELALTAIYPDRTITVINQGVPRQTAQQMAARFPADVVAAEPALVVWEVGIVDAVRGVQIDDFAAALQAGVDAVKKRPIDMMLVDMQFSRKVNAVIDFERYLDTVRRTGELNEIYVFPRYAMMRYWSEQNMFNLEEVTEHERARLAADVYDCIGRRLAEAIRTAVR